MKSFPAQHFTTGVSSKESKQKRRRWSYQAHVDLGTGHQVLKLHRVVVGNSKTALDVCKEQEEQLKESVEAVKNSKVIVEALAHETVSDEIARQLESFQDMAEILHLALSLASEEMLRKEKPTLLNADGETAIADIKQDEIDATSGRYYLSAAQTLRASRRHSQDSSGVEQLETTDSISTIGTVNGRSE